MRTRVFILKAQDVKYTGPLLWLKFKISQTHTLSYTHSHKQLTIKPLASFDICILVTVPHEFLLVLLYQAVKAVAISAPEMFLCCLLEKRKKKQQNKISSDVNSQYDSVFLNVILSAPTATLCFVNMSPAYITEHVQTWFLGSVGFSKCRF